MDDTPTTIEQAAEEFVEAYGEEAVEVLRGRAEAAAEIDDALAAETWHKAADAAAFASATSGRIKAPYVNRGGLRMSKRMRLAAAFVAALGSALAVFAPAQAQAPGVIVGTLSCSVASGFGFIFGSSRAINCTFGAPGGRYEHYV